jgi:hypothetical protein
MDVQRLSLVSLAAVGIVMLLVGRVDAQGREGGVGQIEVGGSPTVSDADAEGPVPRLPDGHVDLTGPWVRGGSNNNMEADAGFKPGELDALLLPWARELKASRDPRDEPYTACLPMGVPRVNPYPWKFAMSYTSRGLTHIYVLHETGDAGAHRVIYMDGRPHPVDPIPTWWGHSVGQFEGDTLVVDTTGYNDKFWFDGRGTPHTEQLHTIERWTRINYGRITNDFTIDDPGAFSRPVQMKFTGRLLRPDLKTGGGDLMEFICQEGNEYGAAAGFVPGTGTSIK